MYRAINIFYKFYQWRFDNFVPKVLTISSILGHFFDDLLSWFLTSTDHLLYKRGIGLSFNLQMEFSVLYHCVLPVLPTRHPATCSWVASYWCKVCPRKEFSNIKQKCKDSSFQAPKALASRKCYMARDFREARYPFTNKIKASNCIMTEFLLHNYEENRLEFDNMFTTIIIAH